MWLRAYRVIETWDPEERTDPRSGEALIVYRFLGTETLAAWQVIWNLCTLIAVLFLAYRLWIGLAGE